LLSIYLTGTRSQQRPHPDSRRHQRVRIRLPNGRIRALVEKLSLAFRTNRAPNERIDRRRARTRGRLTRTGCGAARSQCRPARSRYPAARTHSQWVAAEVLDKTMFASCVRALAVVVWREAIGRVELTAIASS